MQFRKFHCEFVLSLIGSLACLPTTIPMAQENALLDHAQRVTQIAPEDNDCWLDEHTMLFRSLSAQAIFDVDIRTHIRRRVMAWQGLEEGVIPTRPGLPRWLPSGAIVIGFDRSPTELGYPKIVKSGLSCGSFLIR